MITVTAIISNVIYHIEMENQQDQKSIIQEINAQIDANNLSIKILKIEISK